MEIYPFKISNYNSMIPNENGWHYLAVKKLSGLLRRITSKNNANFYCLNCLYSFRI